MIYGSIPWKKELYKNFSVIARFRFLQKKSFQSYIKIEKAIFIGSYIIRKLNDAEKIPPDFLKKKEKISLYKKKKDVIIDSMNNHRLENNYNFEKIQEENRDWEYILNQIIHSYSFEHEFNSKNKSDSILINSDYTKENHIFIIPIKLILTMFLTISEGEITEANSDRDNKKGEMKLKWANYQYPTGLNISDEIEKTLKGEIYKSALLK